MGTENLPKLPVIQFSMETLKPGTSCWFSVRKDVLHALEEYGCFIAIYDKVSFELQNAIFSSSKELLDLPLEIKIKNTFTNHRHGYVGKLSTMPVYESLGIEDATNIEKTQSFTNLMWSAGNDRFCESAHMYSKLVAGLDEMVTRMVFESYGFLEEKYHEYHKASTMYLLRFNKYRVPLKNENDIGIHPHNDSNFATIIHQHQVSGLEVQTKKGVWIGVDPLPLSCSYMAGDGLVVWSNGRIRGARHRVLMKENKPRYSIGIFVVHDGIIAPAKELVDDEHPLMYKSFDYTEYLRFFATEEGMKAYTAGRTLQAYCGI